MPEKSRRSLFKYWPVLMFALFLMIGLSLTSEAQANKIQVYVDQHQIEFTIDPYLEQGRTLVQLRPLFESLGIELEWEGETQTVHGKKGDDQLQLTIGKSVASINGNDVSLDVPARLIDGHTLVPLRFVGEATGATVGWHGDTRTIHVLSKEFIEIMGISSEEAETIVNSEPRTNVPLAADELRGFYARGSADLLNIRNCHGMCWDYYYFFNDHQYIRTPPPAREIDCNVDSCFNYEVRDDQLILNGRSHRFELTEVGMYLDGNHFNRHEPLLRPKLDGTYVANSYTQMPLGGSFATTSTFVFLPDGTFLDDRFIGVITDGSESGDGSGVSSTHTSDSEAAGRYTVINHAILLEYEDGTTESLPFFRPDLNERMFKIGGRDFLISEPMELDPEYEEQMNQLYNKTDPFPDILITDGLADKTIIHQVNPEDNDWWGGAEIVLHSYQWAELDIKPEHQARFTGFGDGTIVALTANYTLINEADEALDLSTLTGMIWTTDIGVSDIPSLSPSPQEGLLAVGESVERMIVFLFPSEVLKESSRFDLAFSELKTESGSSALLNLELEFQIESPY